MKNKLLLVGLLIVSFISCKSESVWEEFEDPVFITYLNDNYNVPITDKGRIDMDDDATQRALGNIMSLHLDGKQISNLSGINNIVSLDYLSCNNLHLTSLDVSRLRHLKVLKCSYNEINSLKTDECKDLYLLLCDNNKLTTLDIKNHVNLRNLHCNSNRLKTLEAQYCINLESFVCGNQTDDKGASRTLTLMLSPKSYSYWEQGYKNHNENQHVTAHLKE